MKETLIVYMTLSNAFLQPTSTEQL